MSADPKTCCATCGRPFAGVAFDVTAQTYGVCHPCDRNETISHEIAIQIAGPMMKMQLEMLTGKRS